MSGTVALASDVLLYHPARGSTPLLLARSTHDGPTHTSYNSPLVLREIPSARVCDGAFCYMLHRASVLNDTRCTAAAVYETLLPYLNHKPLLANCSADTADRTMLGSGVEVGVLRAPGTYARVRWTSACGYG